MFGSLQYKSQGYKINDLHDVRLSYITNPINPTNLLDNQYCWEFFHCFIVGVGSFLLVRYLEQGEFWCVMILSSLIFIWLQLCQNFWMVLALTLLLPTKVRSKVHLLAPQQKVSNVKQICASPKVKSGSKCSPKTVTYNTSQIFGNPLEKLNSKYPPCVQ